MPELEVRDSTLRMLQSMARHATRDDLLNEIAQIWCQTFSADSCDILFREPSDSLLLKSSTLIPGLANRLRLGRGIGLSGSVMLTGEPIFIAKDAQLDK